MILSGGQAFTYPQNESWQATMTLAFIDCDGIKMLHQMWISSTGRTAWCKVPEISRYFAETGNG